ncbi:MAG TPA: hypothetical protein VF142_12780, partial [Longimicrobium sp.]
MSLDPSEPHPPRPPQRDGVDGPQRPPEPDPDATLPMPTPGPEALGDAARSADPADEAVEPTVNVPRAARSSTAASALIAAGILLSRVAGLIRTRVV